MGDQLYYYDDNYNLIGSYHATSGRPGTTDPKVPYAGPIPPGLYYLLPSEISQGGFLRNLLGDWGKYRVPLHPFRNTETYNRSNFFLHGGKKPGSAGCIDIGDKDTELFPLLEKLENFIPLLVLPATSPTKQEK